MFILKEKIVSKITSIKALSGKSDDTEEEKLLMEVNKILTQSLFSKKNVLSNLPLYKQSFEYMEEDEDNEETIYTKRKIFNLCAQYRLRFLSSTINEDNVPYEALIKVNNLNKIHCKNLKHFAILAPYDYFSQKFPNQEATLFAKTLYGNYVKIHTWGKTNKLKRILKCFHLKNFESLALTLFTLTLIETLLVPTSLITKDSNALYFNGYRVIFFLQFIIINAAFLTQMMFTFRVKLSCFNWNEPVGKI